MSCSPCSLAVMILVSARVLTVDERVFETVGLVDGQAEEGVHGLVVRVVVVLVVRLRLRLLAPGRLMSDYVQSIHALQCAVRVAQLVLNFGDLSAGWWLYAMPICCGPGPCSSSTGCGACSRAVNAGCPSSWWDPSGSGPCCAGRHSPAWRAASSCGTDSRPHLEVMRPRTATARGLMSEVVSVGGGPYCSSVRRRRPPGARGTGA